MRSRSRRTPVSAPSPTPADPADGLPKPLRLLLDTLSEPAHVVDEELRILFINEVFRAWCLRLGLPKPFSGCPLFEAFPFLPPSVADEYREAVAKERVVATTEKSLVGDTTLMTETRKIPMACNGRTFTVTLIREVGTAAEAGQAERDAVQQLSRSRKLESIGRLAGGIAHDFSNLLTTIIGYSHILLDGCEDGDPAREHLGEIMHAAERAGNLTSQLLSIGREDGELRPMDINNIVVETDRLLRRVLGEDVEIVTRLGDGLGGVKVDPGKVQQVILNLGINARDAMEKGGKLSIETERIELDAAFCGARKGLEPGRYVRLAVSDTGCGIAPEELDRIFEPFYTTKAPDKGSGMGLATVHDIVSEAGGWIDVDSRPKEGTCFACYLPAHEDMAVEIIPQSGANELPRGTETVLVVEDEPTVRHLTAENLRSLGYDLLEAGNGAEALGVFRSAGRPIHLVLTDMVMPLVNGRELIRRLRKNYAGTADFKVLFMSGFAERILARRKDGDRTPLLEKPFTRERLALMVRGVLDDPEQKG